MNLNLVLTKKDIDNINNAIRDKVEEYESAFLHSIESLKTIRPEYVDRQENHIKKLEEKIRTLEFLVEKLSKQFYEQSS